MQHACSSTSSTSRPGPTDHHRHGDAHLSNEKTKTGYGRTRHVTPCPQSPLSTSAPGAPRTTPPAGRSRVAQTPGAGTHGPQAAAWASAGGRVSSILDVAGHFESIAQSRPRNVAEHSGDVCASSAVAARYPTAFPTAITRGTATAAAAAVHGSAPLQVLHSPRAAPWGPPTSRTARQCSRSAAGQHARRSGRLCMLPSASAATGRRARH